MKQLLIFFTTALLFTSCVKDRNIPTPTTVNNGSRTLIDYWNFNGSSFSTTATISNVSGDSLHFDFTTVDDTTGYADFLSPVTPTTNINAQNGDPAGNALRVRNPCTDFIITAPTTGYNNIVVSYSEAKSSNGALTNTISYSIDGTNYIPYPGSVGTYTVQVDPDYTLETFDFSSITGVSNNPNFKFKITFSNGNTATSGNDRFDNLTVEGNSISGGSSNIPVITSKTTANGTVSTVFADTITASNTPTSFSLTGIIPTGLTINATTGIISGTPTATGVFVDTVKATNTNGTGTQILTITIAPPATLSLIDYWNFNNTASLVTLIAPTVGNGTLTPDFTGAGYYDSVASTTLLNAQNGDTMGNALRVRNPSVDLIISAPTTGYKNIVVSYAVAISSTTSGALTDSVYYSVDGGNTYTNSGLSPVSYNPPVDLPSPGTGYTLISYNLSSIPSVNGNAGFKFKVVFSNGNTGTKGNTRFDNITVQGNPQ